MICKLCESDKQLRNSHIIPEFCYKAMYDEKHKFFGLSTIENQKNKFFQKGLRKYLLCDDCELRFSKYESYASKMFTEQNSVKINSNSFAIENLNYELLKLFQLSILWRLIVSNENKFPNINMDSQEQKLRTLILKDDPGEPEDFGCYMSLILFENGIMDGIITPAEHININSNDYIRIVFGGFIWLFTLIEKNHSSLRKYFINKEGKIIIDIKQAEKLGFLIKYAKDLQKSGNLDD